MKTIIIFFCCFFSFAFSAKAVHIFGGDISYINVSGNTYEVTLTLYGDCGSGSPFNSLSTAVPRIEVYDGTTAFGFIDLSPSGVIGLEVTPVCPSQAGQTTCVNPSGSIVGVAQFIFKGAITLNGISTNWLFRFAGGMGNSAGTGRSQHITNIVQPTGPNSSASVMGLEATLNNTVGINNSPTFTTIPTPFFCINTLQNYNQGAVDVENDNLSFSLVPGLDFSANSTTGLVPYVSPYTYDFPLATSAGSFSFNTINGQMSFIPNAVQRSLVVNKVVETRNGVVVGTSMREMTFIVLSNCSNQSPTGTLSNISAGSINAQGEIEVCEQLDSVLQISINGSDPDGNNISATVNGLPANATPTIVGNNTPTPTITINWNMPSPLVGASYTFYITYQDDACPLSSKQTIAYTVHFLQPISASFAITPESCNPQHDGQINVMATTTNGNLSYAINNDSLQSNHTFSNLNAGTYFIKIKDDKNCYYKDSIIVTGQTRPVISQISTKNISCYGSRNGFISLITTPTNATYNYALLPSNITNQTGVFDSLQQNNYTIIVNDKNGCADTANMLINEPPQIQITSIKINDLTCDKQNGMLIAHSNFTDSVYYFLAPGVGKNDSGFYQNLSAGTYTLYVVNENGCTAQTTVTINTIPKTFAISTTQHDLDCQGDGTEGYAEVFPVNGTPPYTYFWSTNPPQTNALANHLFYGFYYVSVVDATGCENNKELYINGGNCCENVYAAEAFTPNGDGINDDWGIVTSTAMEIKQYMVVNRWGQKIWESSDQRTRWDGRFKNRIVDQDTYYYLLQYKCLSDNKMYSKKGDISVIR